MNKWEKMFARLYWKSPVFKIVVIFMQISVLLISILAFIGILFSLGANILALPDYYLSLKEHFLKGYDLDLKISNWIIFVISILSGVGFAFQFNACVKIFDFLQRTPFYAKRLTEAAIKNANEITNEYPGLSPYFQTLIESARLTQNGEDLFRAIRKIERYIHIKTKEMPIEKEKIKELNSEVAKYEKEFGIKEE